MRRRILSQLKLAVGEGRRVLEVGDIEIGGRRLIVAAGPCAVEGREQLMETAWAVKRAGATMLRGGAYKPRTTPYSFQGLGEEGLRLLAEAREETGLPVVTEVLSPGDVSLVERYADVLQIGARNMQNYPLLRRVGRSPRPVLLKRGLAATLEEWLSSAEYILREGNEGVILCERGVRGFEPLTRFTLDLCSIPLLRELTPLPVMVDPSHAAGRRSLVPALARAAVAAGSDGLLIEVHPHPEEALSDGEQSLTPGRFNELMRELRRVAEAVGRSL